MHIYWLEMQLIDIYKKPNNYPLIDSILTIVC